MEIVIKDPDENLDYTVDLTVPLTAEGDTITSHLVTPPEGITLGAHSHTNTTVTAWLSGGTPDTDYVVSFRATTAAGRVYERSITLAVRQPGLFIRPVDFIGPGFVTGVDEVKLDALIDDFTAQAMAIAPCLAAVDAATALTQNQKRIVRAVLRTSIIRWLESDGGSLQQQVAGPFAMSVDTRSQRRGFFSPTEIDQLQSVCGLNVSSGAFSIDTFTAGEAHLPWCALAFGAEYCSCGADIAGYPIYELD